ncbi:UBP-type zinc finger domain-containing protein [Streptomyces sp. NPDC058611]|uniref:UBP-type zinc finger domain-containing protein n=1 Tax=unclassified Streptomyces TaxID=2593676 RepID=UPI003651D388
MQRWTVAYDAGRPEGGHCAHLDQEDVESTGHRAPGCAECVAAGQRWVHLRTCLTCGNIGCCDSSRGKHSWSHAERTSHAVARSAEAGEEWAWCYEDHVFLWPAGPGARGPGASVRPGRGEAGGTSGTAPHDPGAAPVPPLGGGEKS